MATRTAQKFDKTHYEHGLVNDASITGIPDQIAQDADFNDVSRPAPGVDSQRLRDVRISKTHISERLMKEYGINPETEDCALIGRPGSVHGDQDVEDFYDNNPGGRMPMRDGKPHYRGDTVLMARPKYIAEEVNKRINENRERSIAEHEAELELTESEMRKMRDENRKALDAMLFGSPTQGMDLERAGRMYSPEQTKQIADRYLFAGRDRVARQPSGDQIENKIDRAVETAKAASKGRSGSFNGVDIDKTTGRIVR